MRFVVSRAHVAVLLLAVLPRPSGAQDSGYFVGVVGGSSQLSGDPTETVSSSGFATSVYKPETGPAVNVFVGRHLREYVTLQASYTWNHHDVAFFAARGARRPKAASTNSRTEPRITPSSAICWCTFGTFGTGRAASDPISRAASGSYASAASGGPARSMAGYRRLQRGSPRPTSPRGWPSAPMWRSETGGVSATPSAKTSAPTLSAVSSTLKAREV